MRAQNFYYFFIMFFLFVISSYAQTDQTNSTNSNISVNLQVYTQQIESPWAENSKICIFVREWILKGAFLFIMLVFILGVAVFSGAAFPEWRNYGTKMILGPIAAVILYVIGISALNFFMGYSICGLKVI
jgi:hypothetical protein